MKLTELVGQLYDHGVSQRYPDLFKVSRATVRAIEERQGILDLTPKALREASCSRSLFDYDFDARPFRIYLAQPLSIQPVIGEPLELSDWVLNLIANHNLLDNVQIFNPASSDFHLLMQDPITYYNEKGIAIGQETTEVIDKMLVDVDYSIVHHCQLVMIDATQAYSVGMSMEMAFARFEQKKILGVIHDTIPPSPWLRHHCDFLVSESELLDILQRDSDEAAQYLSE